MNKTYIKIDGIHCKHCIDTISKELYKYKNIKNIKIINNIAHISYINEISHNKLIKTINSLGYITKEEYL